MLDLGLQGVHVLISGAAGGIGVPTVKLFLEQGAKVTAHYNSTSTSLDTDEYLSTQSKAGQFQAVQADVAKEEDVDRLFDQAENGFGGEAVKILVVNHAIYNSTPAPIAHMTLSQFTQTHTVNLTGSFLLIRRFLQGLEKARERVGAEEWERAGEGVAVVLIGSTAGEFGEANHSDYASSKSALTHGFMLSLKNEIVKLHPRARVNTVSPGWVRTKMAEKALEDGRVVGMALATTPLRKIATPLDIASQIVILSSARVSGHVTGQNIKLHGGMEGRLLNPDLIS